MNKNILMVLLFFIVFICCGCNEKEKAYEAAKMSYSEGNYVETINNLAEIEVDDSEIEEIKKISEGFIAYENKDYENAVEILKNCKLNDEQKNVLIDSKINIYLSELQNLDNNISEIIYEYKKEKFDTSVLDERVLALFSDCYHSDNYDDYLYADDIISTIKNGDIVSEIKKLKKDTEENRTLAYLSDSKWIRIDGTSLDGIILKILVNNKKISAIIDDIGDSKSEKGFKKNDLKWNNGQYIDSKTFSINDLTIGTNNGYLPASATILYSCDLIFVHVADDNNEYKRGVNQAYMKLSKYTYYNERGSKLSKEDFKYNGEDIYSDLKSKTKSASDFSGIVYFGVKDGRNHTASLDGILASYGVGEINIYDSKTAYIDWNNKEEWEPYWDYYVSYKDTKENIQLIFYIQADSTNNTTDHKITGTAFIYGNCKHKSGY